MLFFYKPSLLKAFPLLIARIAQSVEQGIENPCVAGSIPAPGTMTFPATIRKTLEKPRIIHDLAFAVIRIVLVTVGVFGGI